MTFRLGGLTLPYIHHPYNYTSNNERAVEVAVGLYLLSKANRALEVGAVLPHYLPKWPKGAHEVIDLYEKCPGVTNADVLSYIPRGQYDLVLSISTLEHLHRAADIEMAITRMKSWLKDGGMLFVTIPHGYRSEVDELVYSGKLAMDVARMDKMDTERNLWEERPLSDAPKSYGWPTRNAHTVYLCFYRQGGGRWDRF